MKICFDLDDTLYDCSQPFKKAMEQFFPDYMDDLYEKYSYYRMIGDLNFPRVLNKEITPDNNGEIRIEETCKKYKIPYTKEDILSFQQVYKYHQYHLELSPIFKTFFEKNHFEYGILTNGDSIHQRKKMESLGLFQYIPKERIITSMDIGISKPDPKVFDVYFEKIHENKEDWIYVGDAYLNDIETSNKAGIKNIYFDRHHKHEGKETNYIVYTEQELVDLLEKLGENYEL